MPSYQRMLFVCLNDRGEDHPKGSCSRDGGAELLDALRGTRCLGQCSHGPVVNVQSEDVWYGGVQASDVPALIDQHVLKGEVLEHLEIPDEKLIGKDPAEQPLPPIQR